MTHAEHPRNPRARLAAVVELVERQAQDDGLWCQAVTAPEAYLQSALRALHAVVEGRAQAECAVDALRTLLAEPEGDGRSSVLAVDLIRARIALSHYVLCPAHAPEVFTLPGEQRSQAKIIDCMEESLRRMPIPPAAEPLPAYGGLGHLHEDTPGSGAAPTRKDGDDCDQSGSTDAGAGSLDERARGLEDLLQAIHETGTSLSRAEVRDECVQVTLFLLRTIRRESYTRAAEIVAQVCKWDDLGDIVARIQSELMTLAEGGGDE